MRMKAVKAAEITGGITYGMSGELVFTGVSTDTRSIESGDLFIAIKGENFDGGDYVMQALEKGAACAITQKEIKHPSVINVKDSVKALGELARYHKNQFGIPVIAVTGSVGKTTVKNMLISVFSQKFNVHHTVGNLNNHIGLPMTLLRIDETHEISILEMGMSGFGEIDYLSYLASPACAVITNIGTAHIGLLGSRKGIFIAKTEVMNHMPDGGIMFVNGDDDMLCNMKTPEGLGVVTFGTADINKQKAEDIEAVEDGSYMFTSNGTRFTLNIPGRHNVINAIGVIAVAREFGIEEGLIQNGLMNVKPEKMRLNRFSHNKVSYINDSYNANPQSMKAALDILAGFSGRKIAVLGDMLEMGKFSEEAHMEIGEYAAKTADILIFCGNEAKHMRRGAFESGLKRDISVFRTSDEATAFLEAMVAEGDTVLVKGSRGMKMENVLKYTEDGGKN